MPGGGVIRACFFDAVWTLIKPSPPSPVLYAELAGRFGIRAEPAALGRALKASWAPKWEAKRAVTRVSGTHDAIEKEWWRAVVLDAFALATGAPCSEECFEAIFAAYATADAWALVPGAIETLQLLRTQGVTTGLISNYDSRLEGVLDAFALRPLLDVVAYSSAVGWEKPDAQIFAFAREAAGIAAGECLHVGDDAESDVGGALAAGFHALWFVGGGSSATYDAATLAASPAPVIRELREAVAWVEASR